MLSHQHAKNTSWISSHAKDIILLCLVQLILGLIYTKTVPRFYGDEIWEASISTRLADHGSLSNGVIHGWGGMHINFVQNQLTQPLFCALIFKMFGFSIFAARFASVLISLLAVAATYKIMQLLYRNRYTAVAITLAVMFNPWFFQAARRVRPEIYYISFSLLFMYFLLTAVHSSSVKRAFIAGALAGLCAVTHPTGLVLCFCMGVSILIWRRPKSIIPLAALLVVGFALTILPYAVYLYKACQNPNVIFIEQMKGGQGLTGSGLASLVQTEINRWKLFFQWPKGAPLAAIYLLGLVSAWVRSTRENKLIATIVCLMAILLMFTTVNTTAIYLISLLPFLSAMMVTLIQRIYQKAKNASAAIKFPGMAISSIFIIIYVGFCLGGIGLMVAKLRTADIDRLTNRIAQAVGPEKKVYGNILLQTGREQGKFNYGPFPLNTDWSQPISIVKPHNFDYAVRLAWDFQGSYGISSPPQKMPAFRNNTIDRICKYFGTKVDEFRDPDYGPVEIYKLDWNKPAATNEEILNKPTTP